MPWKNGGGVTTEILAWPPEAGFDDFDWRISMAQVAAGGPFSVFPGIDRTLTVLSGSMRLAVGGAAPVELSPFAEPHGFSGDAQTEATLVDGPVLDFNVMTRRARFSHAVRRLEFIRPTQMTFDRDANLLFVVSGAILVGHDSAMLAALDTLYLDSRPTALSIEPVEPTTLLAISIRRQ